MVRSPKFYSDRKISGKTEQLLCLIHRDPVKGTWERKNFVITIYDPVKGTYQRLPPINDLHFPEMPQFCDLHFPGEF
jgi:hypothetical protein